MARYWSSFAWRAARPEGVSEIRTARRSVGSATRDTRPRADSTSIMRVVVGDETPAAADSWRLVRGPAASGSSTWNWASETPSADERAASRPRARRVAWKKSASASLSVWVAESDVAREAISDHDV